MNLWLFTPEITLGIIAILVILLDLGVQQKNLLRSVSLSGLVIAGAAFMREGTKVTLLQTGEQPGDRP